MSKIGKKPIDIPEGVKVKIEGQEIEVEGKLGKLKKTFPEVIKPVIKDKQIHVKFEGKKEKKPLWGTWRSLIANMIKGVKDGFKKELELHGVGYRAQKEGKKLILRVGFSHPVEYQIPDDVEIEVKKNIISIFGKDKEKVGQVAAEIRKIRPPEPYKGKGIRYKREAILRKVSKKAKAGK